MTDAPRSAADARPNGEPYYIDADCEACGTALELYDPNRDPVWHDEWVCPECDDGIRMDWPQAEYDRLTGRVEDFDSERAVPLEDFDI